MVLKTIWTKAQPNALKSIVNNELGQQRFWPQDDTHTLSLVMRWFQTVERGQTRPD